MYVTQTLVGTSAPKKSTELIHKLRSICRPVLLKTPFSFSHVYSHQGHTWNDLADELADTGINLSEFKIIWGNHSVNQENHNEIAMHLLGGTPRSQD